MKMSSAAAENAEDECGNQSVPCEPCLQRLTGAMIKLVHTRSI